MVEIHSTDRSQQNDSLWGSWTTGRQVVFFQNTDPHLVERWACSGLMVRAQNICSVIEFPRFSPLK